MRRVNIVLLDEQDNFVKYYQKENQCNCLDEALNKMIIELKDFIEGKGNGKRKRK